MTFKITRKGMYGLIVDMALLVVVIILYGMNLSSFKVVFCMATTIYVCLFITWFQNCQDKINFFTIILLLSYIYTFGQYLLYCLDIEIQRQYTILNTFTPREINSAAIYILLNIIVFHASVLVFNKRIVGKNKEELKSKDKKAFKLTACMLLLVTFVCELMVLVFKIKINMAQGYSVALRTNYSGAGSFSYIINFLSTLFLPSVFATFIVSKGKKENKLVWLIYTIYLGGYFMSGSRFEAIISLAGVLLLYNFYYKRVNIKKTTFIFAIGLVVLYLCSIMSNMRIIQNYGKTMDFATIITEAVDVTNEENFIADVVSTAGMQVLTVTAVYNNCPSNESFTYGMYYLGGLVRVIPNIFGGDNPLITASIDKIFRQYLTKTYGMGSSFIIEAYYNFGWLGILMMIIYGYATAFLCKSMETVRRNLNQNMIFTYFIFYMASTAMFYVRSDARFIIREIVFYYFGVKVLVWVVKTLFFRHTKVGGDN